jgi:hypothetical protein
MYPSCSATRPPSGCTTSTSAALHTASSSSITCSSTTRDRRGACPCASARGRRDQVGQETQGSVANHPVRAQSYDNAPGVADLHAVVLGRTYKPGTTTHSFAGSDSTHLPLSEARGRDALAAHLDFLLATELQPPIPSRYTVAGTVRTSNEALRAVSPVNMWLCPSRARASSPQVLKPRAFAATGGTGATPRAARPRSRARHHSRARHCSRARPGDAAGGAFMPTRSHVEPRPLGVQAANKPTRAGEPAHRPHHARLGRLRSAALDGRCRSMLVRERPDAGIFDPHSHRLLPVRARVVCGGLTATCTHPHSCPAAAAAAAAATAYP